MRLPPDMPIRVGIADIHLQLINVADLLLAEARLRISGDRIAAVLGCVHPDVQRYESDLPCEIVTDDASYLRELAERVIRLQALLDAQAAGRDLGRAELQRYVADVARESER